MSLSPNILRPMVYYGHCREKHPAKADISDLDDKKVIFLVNTMGDCSIHKINIHDLIEWSPLDLPDHYFIKTIRL